MNVNTSLQPSTLLCLNYPSLSAHFIELIGTQPSSEHVDAINAHLLNLIHGESLPSDVYKIWLPIALKHSPHLLSMALRDPVSHHVRAVGIQQVARISRTSSWKSRVWDILGSAEGIRDIVQDLSIVEIENFLEAIAQSIRRPDDELPVLMDQLVQLLRQDKSSRALWRHLDTLLPLCSPSFLENVLPSIPEARLTSKLLNRTALRHTPFLRRIASGAATVPSYVQKNVTECCVRAMICSSEPYTHADPSVETADVLPGIELVLDVVFRMLGQPLKKVNPSWINPYIHESLRHICRQKAPFEQICYLIERSIGLIALESYEDLTELIFKELIRYWSIAGFGTAVETNSPTKRLPHPEHPSRPSAKDKKNLEDLIVRVIFDCPIKISHFSRRPSPWKIIETLLQGIAPEARLPFIKLLFFQSTELQFDLDLPPSAEEKKLLGTWPYSIMKLLPASDIKQLFDRMLLIHGATDYLPVVDDEFSVLSWPAQCQLKARCEADVATSDDDFPATRYGISEMRRRAEKDKDPEKRLDWANQTVETALVSGSLGLFDEVVQWSARFIRDSTVFPELISNILSSNSAKLLGCAAPTSAGRAKTLPVLRRQVEQADGILMSMLTLLTKASKEPLDHFRVNADIMTFLEETVANRMRSLRRYQKQLSQSEADLAALLLDPLIEVLLRYDEAGDDFKWWTGGKVMLPDLEIEHFNSTPACFSFMDRFIQRRDELWMFRKSTDSESEDDSGSEEGSENEDDSENEDHSENEDDSENAEDSESEGDSEKDDDSEAAENSETDEVSDEKPRTGFPQGLAVQDLIPSCLIPLCVDNPDAVPYAATRFRDVLFGAVDVLMCPVSNPEDGDDTKVDRLDEAVNSYVSLGSRKGRDERLLRVWKHYETILEPYPEHLTIFRHWLARVAREWGWQKVSWTINPISVPETSCLDRPLESVVKWDPRGDAGKKDEITVPLTVLYCRMQGEIPSDSEVTEELDRQCDPEQIWTSDYISHLSPTLSMRGCDAVVLSALLFLGTLTKQPILSEAFPSPEAARWPPIALDSLFVSLAKKNLEDSIDGAIQALSRGITFVPTHVLHRLTMSLLDNLPLASGSRYAMLLQCVVHLTKLFPATDQPEMGIDVVLRIIKHFPDDSAHHRHLRLTRMGQSLRPDDAVLPVQTLADFVCERLGSPSAFVKITTVKMVAQVVAAADFIPTSNSLSILQSIYYASSHVDVQTEVVSSMLSLLERDPEQADDFYPFLRKLTLSAVGPNRQDQSSEWQTAEKEQKLPDISGLCSRRNLELFSLTAFHKLPESHRSRYVQEILLPMVDESIAQHNRWMRGFLHHFEVTGERFDLDFGPFVPDTIDFVLNTWHNYLPASFLLYNRSSVLTYTTTPAFETINHLVLTSPKASSLEYKSALQHWAEVLDFRRAANPFHHLSVLLSRNLQSTLPEGKGITEPAILSEYQHRMSVVAHNPERFDRPSGERITSHYNVIDGLFSLRRPRDSSPLNPYDRYQTFTTLMSDIVLDIWRLKEENADNGLSAKLPSTVHLQAILLPAPHFNPLHPSPVTAFVREVTVLIRRCSDPVMLFEAHHIEDKMGLVGAESIIPVALKLGDGLDVNSTDLKTYLTVRIVGKLLSKAKRRDIRADEKVEGMLKAWKESRNEYVSRKAWEIYG